jgi:hypothetical protein
MTTWRVLAVLAIVAALSAAAGVAYMANVWPPYGAMFVVAGAGALGFAALCFVYPYVTLLMTFFMLPFEYLLVIVPADTYGSGTFINYITWVKLMFGAMIATGLIRMLVLKDERPFKDLFTTPIPLMLLLFAVMLWASLANAQRLGKFAVTMMTLISGLVAFFILILLVRNRERVYLFLKVVFLSYIIISLMGLFEAITRQHILALLGFPMIDRPWVTNPDAFRICGPSGDPDYYAISVIFGLMVSFAVLPLVRGFFVKAGVFAVILLHFVVIVATASRGAALSTAFALGLLYIFARIPHKVLVGVTSVLILGAAFGIYTVTVSARAAQRYSQGDTKSFDERWGWIRMCYKMMIDAPIRGIGTGNFQGMYTRYMDTYLVPREPESGQNTYAMMAAQNGIPTTLVYAFTNLALWFVLYRAMRGTRDRRLEHVCVSFFCLALSFWLFSLTLDLVISEISWIIFAMGVILWRITKEDHDERERSKASGLPPLRPRRPLGAPIAPVA